MMIYVDGYCADVKFDEGLDEFYFEFHGKTYRVASTTDARIRLKDAILELHWEYRHKPVMTCKLTRYKFEGPRLVGYADRNDIRMEYRDGCTVMLEKDGKGYLLFSKYQEPKQTTQHFGMYENVFISRTVEIRNID